MVVISEQEFPPRPGTARHPQGRMFKPEYSSSPERLYTDNWLQSDNRDVVAWHHNMGDLPEFDSDGRMGPPGDYLVTADPKDRPVHKDLGYMQGMHFGTPAAGFDRWGKQQPVETAGGPATTNPAVQGHPVRLPRSAMHTPTKDTRRDGGDPRWSDHQANFSSNLQDAVDAGGVVPYRNDVEDEGSTSYKALRETARTWSDDVMDAKQQNTWGMNRVSPGQFAAAERGYNPVLRSGRIMANAQRTQQPHLPYDNPQTLARTVHETDRTSREMPSSVRDTERSVMGNPAPHVEMRRPMFR